MPPDELNWFNDEVKPCEPALRAFLHRRFPQLSDHDDLVQESYSRIVTAKRAGKLTNTRSFLFTVARNLAIDLFRRRHRAVLVPLESDDQEIPALTDTADIGTALDLQQRRDILLEAVSSLPDRCRAVLRLRLIDGLSYKEIADRLGLAENTVRVHMANGTLACEKFFTNRGLLGPARPATTKDRGSAV